MLSLSASQPTVSATRGPGGAHRLHHRIVDALDQVVALLVELVHRALGRRHLVVVRHARLVFLVPQLAVGLRQLRDQLADGFIHAGAPGALTRRGGTSCRTPWSTASTVISSMQVCSGALRRIRWAQPAHVARGELTAT